MRGGVVYCNACGSHNNPGLKKCSTCGCQMNPQGVRTNPITTAEFANRKMAVFDLDMTILDNRQRFTDAVRAGVINKDGSPKKKGGWKKRGEFLYEPTRLMKDRLMPNAMDLIEHLMEEGYMIAYCTARPITYYEVTKDQLEDKGLPMFQDASGADLLFCKRSIGQKTPLYKADVIRTLQAQYDVRLFFDDMYDNCSAVLKEDVPGVYGSIEEYYKMIKGVKKNPYPTYVDEKGYPVYDPDAAPYDSADSHGDDLSGMGRKLLRQNPGMMYSPMDLERAYESIKGTKIQTNPGPKGEMCGSCVYMCMSSGKCKKWSEMKGSPVYVASDWYCKAYKIATKKNPKGRFLDGEAATLVFVKPRGLNAWIDIKRMLPGPIMMKRWVKIDRKLISEHYAEHSHKPHFSKLVDYYDGRWVLALVVSARYDAVRAVIGSSKPDQLKEGDIRKAILDTYGDSSLGILEDWTSGVDNGIHASDSVEAANKELDLWFGRKIDKQPKKLNLSSHPVDPKEDGGFHPFVGMTLPLDNWNQCVEIMVDFYEGMPWLPDWVKGKQAPDILIGGVAVLVLLAPYTFKAIVGREPTVQGGNPFNADDPLPESQKIHLAKLVEDLRRRRPTLLNPRRNPIKRGSDSKGSYYRWGKNQKYYYKTGSKTSRENARKKAYKQAQAAFAGGYRGNPHDEVVGKHCILELYDCDPKLLDDEKFIHKMMKSAAKGANMQFLDFVSHEFEPQGVTALTLLGESHISIHTWPELGYAMVDVLTCGEKSKPADACEIICKKLKAKNHTLKFFMRESPAYRRMILQNPEAYSEDYMVPRDIDKLGKAADSMEATYHDGMEVPEWWKSKLSVTADKADNLSDALSYVADNPRSNPPKSKVEKGKELYKHMNGKAPAKTETKVIDIGDVWYQVGEGGCWQIGYMSGKETGSSSQKYVHHFNEETKNGDFPKLYATIPDKGKPMLIITGGTWKIKTDEEGIAWIYD